MRYRVTLFPGDWVGPELTAQMQRVVAATGVTIDWETFELGQRAVERGLPSVPEEALASAHRNRVVFKAKHASPMGSPNPIFELRKKLDLFANVRRIRTLPGLPSRWPELDIVVVRENTEDIYAGIEHEVKPGVFESMKVTTEAACERVARYCFQRSRELGRKHVTIVHKANIMKLSDGMFMRTAQRIAAEYPEIAHRTIIADNICMQLVMNPMQFDVILAANLFGDILSDLGAGLVGGISAVPGANFGDDMALFECFHGEVPELVGQDRANPVPILMPAISMLGHLGEKEAGRRLFRAVRDTLTSGRSTGDLGGTSRTSEFCDAVIARL